MADKKFITKNGLQTQNINFVSPNNTYSILAEMLDSDTIAFSGSSGQLFSITDSLTGTIFSVNDISGIPSIEVLDDGTIRLAQYAGNVGIGKATPTAKLDIADTTLAGSGSLAGSVLNLTQTWNTSGTPTAIKLNVTNTASGGIGRLLDLQVGGTSVFYVGRDGVVRNASIAAAYADGVCITAQAASRCFAVGYLNGNNVQLGSTTSFGWTAGADSYAALETILVRDAAHTIAQRNGVNAQAFRIYNTYTDASNYERGYMRWNSNFFELGAEALGTGSNRAVRFLTSGFVRMTVSSTVPEVTLGNDSGAPGIFSFTGAYYTSQTNGRGLCLYTRTSTTANDIGIALAGEGITATSGVSNIHTIIHRSFVPTSGTGAFQLLRLAPTINQTGGANGASRGIVIAPSLTSAADWAALESTNGTFIIGDTYASGSGSLAGSLLNLTQTWNTTGTPTAIKLNVTDTASNAASLLMDLQVGGVSMFKVAKTGRTDINNTLSTGGFNIFCGALMATSFIGVDSSGDTKFHRDAAGIFAQRNGVNAQALRVYNTYTDASNYERAKIAWESNVLRIGTEKAGTGTARQLDLQTDGTTRISIAGNGSISTNNAITVVSGFIATIAQVGVAGSGTQYCYDAGTTAYSGASGATTLFAARSAFSPTSGTMTYSGFAFLGTINQTGGANGITRGLYVAPTLTSAADWRAIEVANGPVKITDTYSAGSGSLAGKILDLAQTWNTTGTPTAIKLNVTDTTSDAASLLVDLQVGGSTKAKIDKTGALTAAGVTSDYYRMSSSMIVTESGTTRTLSTSDDGKVIVCTSNSAVTITVDTTVGTAGFSVTVIQNGTGQVSFSASGTTINNRQSQTKTAGQYAVVSLICRTSNTFVLAGDTGA